MEGPWIRVENGTGHGFGETRSAHQSLTGERRLDDEWS